MKGDRYVGKWSREIRTKNTWNIQKGRAWKKFLKRFARHKIFVPKWEE